MPRNLHRIFLEPRSISQTSSTAGFTIVTRHVHVVACRRVAHKSIEMTVLLDGIEHTLLDVQIDQTAVDYNIYAQHTYETT